MKNAGKQNETELEWIDKGNAKEKYKGKENSSKIMTLWQKVLCQCHYGPALLTFWFQTDVDAKIQPVREAGKTEAIHFSHHSHALITLYDCPIFMLWLVKIWQGSSCRKFVQHRETCLLWQLKLRVFCQLVMLFTVFFHWMHKMKYSCYQQSSVIHGWFVYWIFGWKMRRISKLEIRFRMTSFSVFHLAGCGLKSPWSDSGLTW